MILPNYSYTTLVAIFGKLCASLTHYCQSVEIDAVLPIFRFFLIKKKSQKKIPMAAASVSQ